MENVTVVRSRNLIKKVHKKFELVDQIEQIDTKNEEINEIVKDCENYITVAKELIQPEIAKINELIDSICKNE